MALSDIDQREHVISAIAVCDDMGRDKFLNHYGFYRALRYVIQYKGHDYDSKAIIAVAHKFASSSGAPLKSKDFSGGQLVVRLLQRLGFHVPAASSWKMEPRAKPRISDAKLRHGAAVIEWEQADYWTDFLPLHFFADGAPRLASHILRQGNQTNAAHCLVTVSGSEVLLDYSDDAVRQINVELENDIGVARLRFGSAARDDIPAVNWYDLESNSWTQQGTFSWPKIPKLTDYILPRNGTSKRRRASVKERPGQGKFRSKLSSAYGEICMLTRCAVDQALDAAHIDPHDGPEFDHPQNGLLLRKDLHCLFDNDLLGFEPTSRIAYFGTASGQVAYADLHGKRSLMTPHRLFASYKPSKGALERRWRIFCKRHGNPAAR
jgi:hypothetical protein